MPNPLIQFVENKGLASRRSIARVTQSLAPLKFLDLWSEFYCILRETMPVVGQTRDDTDDDFRFVPTASLRGEYGCSDLPCRLSKVELLARYGALYGDQIILPLRTPLRSETIEDDRRNLELTLLSVHLFRPLLEHNLAIVVPDRISLCAQHFEEQFPRVREIEQLTSKLCKEKAKDFSITYFPPGTELKARPCFEVIGPDEFLEHGGAWLYVLRAPAFLRRTRKPVRLTTSQVVRTGLLRCVFGAFANDTYVHSFHSVNYRGRVIAGLPGEALFLDELGERHRRARETRALFGHLSHSVPLFGELPIPTLCRLRKEEPNAFLRYRSALDRTLKLFFESGKAMDAQVAKSLYLDILQPKLLELEHLAKEHRRTRRKRAAIKGLMAAGALGLGMTTGVLPAGLLLALKAAGTLGVASEIGELLASIERNPTEVRNDNLYFLLRLKQELT